LLAKEEGARIEAILIERYCCPTKSRFETPSRRSKSSLIARLIFAPKNDL
jgi:hypothetical protein